MAVLVGKQAPDFTATAVFGDNQIKDLKLSDYRGKYVVMFFYPLDFTFVCPSELSPSTTAWTNSRSATWK